MYNINWNEDRYNYIFMCALIIIVCAIIRQWKILYTGNKKKKKIQEINLNSILNYKNSSPKIKWMWINK